MERVQKKLLDFFGSGMLQLFEFELRPYRSNGFDRSKRALARALRAGQSRHSAPRSFDSGASCVIKPMRQFETTGDCRPRKFGRHKRPTLAAHEGMMRASVAARPDLTITKLWQNLMAIEIKVGRSNAASFCSICS